MDKMMKVVMHAPVMVMKSEWMDYTDKADLLTSIRLQKQIFLKIYCGKSVVKYS